MRGPAAEVGLLLLFNDSPQTRSPLSLAQSTDGGLSWQVIAQLETDPVGRFHYPAIIQSALQPHSAHACYTYELNSTHSIAYANILFGWLYLKN